MYATVYQFCLLVKHVSEACFAEVASELHALCSTARATLPVRKARHLWRTGKSNLNLTFPNILL